MEVGWLALPVDDMSRVGEARREAALLARRVGFSEDEQSRVSIVASELATNLQRHATRERWFFARAMNHQATAEIELIALDGGPGIASLPDAERDGFSTSGGSGQGIGAVRRLASELDIHTTPAGTAVLARLLGGAPVTPATTGAVRVAKRGEVRCGDAWAAEVGAAGASLLVADGLGHGFEASEASERAVTCFRATAGHTVRDRIRLIHEALLPTRGAAIALAHVDFAAARVTYGGLGNISGVIARPGESRSLVSLHGTAGRIAPRITEFQYDWSPDALLIMHSDGVSSHWDLASYPGLLRRHPSLVAAVLFRDHTRHRDDACVAVLREPPAP